MAPLKKRELGTSKLDLAYNNSWRGSEWRMFLPPVGSVSKAVRTLHPDGVTRAQPDSPGIYELAITHRDFDEKRIKVFIGATTSLRRDAFDLWNEDQHPLRGFVDHALKEGHCIWWRSKPHETPEAADAALMKVLAVFDYAWNDQSHAPARSLVLKDNYCCFGCCWRRGFKIVEGPAKRTKVGVVNSMTSMLSLGRSKKR